MRVTTSAVLSALAGAAIVACGSSSSAPAASQQAPGFSITISGLSFSPLDLHVPPGATVTVVNRDGMIHSVTSEASPNSFVHAAASGVSFDTGQFTGSRTFTIPANAPNGAVVPYFCTSHLGTMVTPNGTITIDSSAQAASQPAGGGGGMGY